MSENGVNGHSGEIGMQWRVGFMNNALKYLTAETFGFKVNTSGVSLKKKQIWFLEQDAKEKWVHIKSHLGRYLTSDKYGEMKAEEEERTEDGRFYVEYSANGKWAIKNGKNNYMSADGKCFSQALGDAQWWSIQLDVHPQICLRNVNRKRYARLVGDAIECKELVPWGIDSLLTLDFVDGKYNFKSHDGRCLHKDGHLQTDVDPNTLFTLEIHDGSLAFKDCNGLYLTAVSAGTMKTKNKSYSKDELFTIEDSHAQVKIKSLSNGKYVSVKQGVDVSANQDPDEEGQVGETEIFQLEYNKPSDTWVFRTCKNECWLLQSGGGVQAKGADPTKNGCFTIDWDDDGCAGIKGCDGKYLSNKATGALISSSSELGDQQKFKIVIVNRPQLVLKSEFGFVGTGTKGQYTCSKAKYDVLSVESTKKDTYIMKGPDGQYIGLGDDNGVCADDSPTEFKFEFCEQSVIRIRAPNGCYLKGGQNGLMRAVAEDRASATLWEY